MFKSLRKFLVLLIIAGVVALFVIFLPKLEVSSPEISFVKETDYLGVVPFDIVFTDKGQGLKNFSVKLISNDKEVLIAEKNYSKGVYSERISIKLDPKEMKLKDGPAKLIVKAEDF